MTVWQLRISAGPVILAGVAFLVWCLHVIDAPSPSFADCVAMRSKALEFAQVHPEITVPYSDPAAEYCRVNEVVKELEGK